MESFLANNLPDQIKTFRFLEDSATFPEKDLNALKKEIADVEDPEKQLPGTVNCLSCHAAQPIRAFLENPERKPEDTRSFRMFGYFGRQPSIMKRVQRETAEVLKKVGLN